jgi:hypothetical protein
MRLDAAPVALLIALGLFLTGALTLSLTLGPSPVGMT